MRDKEKKQNNYKYASEKVLKEEFDCVQLMSVSKHYGGHFISSFSDPGP